MSYGVSTYSKRPYGSSGLQAVRAETKLVLTYSLTAPVFQETLVKHIYSLTAPVFADVSLQPIYALIAPVFQDASLQPIYILSIPDFDQECLLYTQYQLKLTGAADSQPDVELDMFQFTARLRSTAQNSLSVSVTDAINAADELALRPNGDLVISEINGFSNDLMAILEIIAVNQENLSRVQGSVNDTLILFGRRQEAYVNKALTIDNPTTKNERDGVIVYQAQINAELKPGDTVTIGADNFLVDEVTFFVGESQANMTIFQ